MSQQTQEWAEKGEMTEQEARRLVDQWLNEQKTTSTTKESASSTRSQYNIEAEIQHLTEQVTALRQELSEKRQKNQP
ncbi:MAG: hypothetical protein AAGF26_19680 [Cyanobacteria bacterium P01_G01_bin.49]